MNNQETLSVERGADSVQRPCSAIVVDAETCLLHSDIDPTSNTGTAALDGYAHDGDGNEWTLDAYVSVKWKRTATGFGKCGCGGAMVAKSPKHPKARVRCNKCGSEMFLSNWLRISPNEKADRSQP